MKKLIKNTPILILRLLCIFPAFEIAHSQNVKFLTPYAIGENIQTENNNYQVVPNGIVRNQASLDDGNSNIIWQSNIGEYEVYIQSTPIRSEYDDSSKEKYFLIYDSSKEKAAIFTGNIIVELNGNANADEIAMDHQLELAHNFTAINQSFFLIPSINVLSIKLEALLSDNRVKNAYPEIIENFRRAQ